MQICYVKLLMFTKHINSDILAHYTCDYFSL